MDIPAGMEILLGKRLGRLIQILAMAVAKPGSCIVRCRAELRHVGMIATFCNMRYVGVPPCGRFLARHRRAAGNH